MEIENVIAKRMLPAEFESRKTSGPQGAPQFLFFVGLFATKTAGIADGVHGRSVKCQIIKGNPSP